MVMLMIAGWYSSMPITHKWGNVLSWDMFGYYLYTPAYVLWDDSGLKDFSKVEEINKKYNSTSSFYQGSRTENGNWMIKYTMGAAVLELPFFAAAHFFAPGLGYEADGFSLPYQKAMIVCHFFYIILGFIFLRKALLRFFSDALSALLLLLIILGTNYYVCSIIGPSIHTMEFALFSIILYLTIRIHESPSMLLAAFLGLTLGFCILTRPPDGLIVIVPALWNVISLKSLKEKIVSVFADHKFKLLVGLVCCFAVGFLQMNYWKAVNDTWLSTGYTNNPGEGFEFLRPYLLQVLFSFRKGWFVYTPLMLCAVAGFYYVYKLQRNIFWPMLAFFILNVYVVSSWSCWYYASSYGQRAMIDSYAILILPLGYFIYGISASGLKRGFKWLIYSLIGFFVLLNIFQSWQYMNGIIDESRMTKEYYLKIFGKSKTEPQDKKLLMVDRSQIGVEHILNINEYQKHVIFYDDFEVPEEAGSKEQYVDSISRSGKYSIMTNSNFIYTHKNELSYNLITEKDHAWIRTTVWYLPKADPKQNPLGLVVMFTNYKGEAYKYSVVDVGTLPEDHVTLGQWNKFVFDYLTPEVRNENDKINIYFWFRGKDPVYIDDFKVEAYEKKEEAPN
jgi:hypothetical protein